MTWRAQGPRKVRLDRLQEYPSATLERVCTELGIWPVTPDALQAATASNPADGHGKKGGNALGRIRFFMENPSDDPLDAIHLCNGKPHGQPDLNEPHFYDGRHRFVAAVLRGDATIWAEFRWGNDVFVFLSTPVMAYLAGDTDVKPVGT